MKVISPVAHGVIDYLSVFLLALSTVMFDMNNELRNYVFMFSGAYLLLSLITNYKPGIIRLVPFPAHGILELISAALLIYLAFTDFQEYALGKYYFLALAIFVVLVFLLTDWNGSKTTKTEIGI